MVRKAWLESGRANDRHRDGQDEFVSIGWDEATRLVAGELDRVRCLHGNQSIYGGSYGWASAGRFHHAQSQLHRFLNCIGGYTRSVNSYSLAAGEVILSRILGDAESFIHTPQSWQSISDSTNLLVAFGGMPARNSQISAGGTGYHRTVEGLRQAKEAGVSFVNISPNRADVSAELEADWMPIRPGSDVALMLGLAHEIQSNGWHDVDFLDRYTEGYSQFATYLTGKTDGVVKSAGWAAELSGVPEQEVKALARRMAQSRTMISVSWSLTRQDNGEQPFWMATTLAAMLGQIGQRGAGVAYGYGAANSVGVERRQVQYATLPQLQNPINELIPVARIADMLLNPGLEYEFNGETRRFPDIRLVYWAGGNPFHHHQDLTRLSEAWRRPETIIVHDYCWNALAKRADIVLPCTTPLERKDIMITPRDRFVVAMKAVISPVGQARDDHDIFRGIAAELGVVDRFADGKDTDEWLTWIYDESRVLARKSGVVLPEYEQLQDIGWHETDLPEEPTDAFTAFRTDPEAAPLKTPSGKIEITSTDATSFSKASLFPFPAWYEPTEWLGRTGPDTPFHLISSQPAEKLHSQLDPGRTSQSAKPMGRTPLSIHPKDASALGLSQGACVRVHNSRGACLATVLFDANLMRGVVQMSTGAWLDAVTMEDGRLLCRNGNPNVLTRDGGTSSLAQGPVAHSCLVAIEPYEWPDSCQAYQPPVIRKIGR
jgi:biotin/methionine sulfoxide reductase